MFCHAHISTSGQTTRVRYIWIMLFCSGFSREFAQLKYNKYEDCTDNDYSGMERIVLQIKRFEQYETSSVLIETKSNKFKHGLRPRYVINRSSLNKYLLQHSWLMRETRT